MRLIEMKKLEEYRGYLLEMEKSAATIEKYLRDIQTFRRWLGAEAEVSKEKTIAYKNYLKEHYKTTSAGSMIVSLNRYLQWLGWNECCVKGIKSQQQMFAGQKELTQEEYKKLVETARKEGKEQLAVLMETIAGTGIRISELSFITVDAVIQGKAEVYCKGKCRQIYLTKELRKRLIKFCRQQQLKTGPVFRTKHGNPLDRSNVWTQMKKLGKRARIDPEKVFPHNLRHLFARTYYRKHKDVVYLADILGHASINTTRIYTRTTCENHIQKLESLGLVS